MNLKDITEDTLPQFAMRLRDRRIQTSYPVRLTCQAVGWPHPEITWYKDSQIISQNGKFFSHSVNYCEEFILNKIQFQIVT